MDTRYLLQTRTHARGAIKPVFIAIVLVVVLLAASAWFLIIKPHQQMLLADSAGHPSTPVAAGTKAAPPPPVNVGAMDLDQLLGEARKAINDQRYLAPAGNNAFEFYLRVLQKQPGNRVAADALRETFPFAATSAEQAINARNFADAQRQIDLLARADPTNFTLTILRSKLDAQRKTLDKQQQDALDQQKQQLAAQKAAADRATADLATQTQAAADKTAADQTAREQARKVEQPRQASADATVSNVPAVEKKVTGKTSDAVLLKAPAPEYPSSALRSRQSGSVVVSFTVDPDGRTSNVKVVSSTTRHIFDRAAMNAVRSYRFTPAMKDGVAVSSRRQQKIDFNL